MRIGSANSLLTKQRWPGITRKDQLAIGNWQLAAGVHFGLCDDAPVGRFCGNGRCLFVANEWDRDMGLLDLVPEIFSPKVVEKMKYVDSLRKR